MRKLSCLCLSALSIAFFTSTAAASGLRSLDCHITNTFGLTVGSAVQNAPASIVLTLGSGLLPASMTSPLWIQELTPNSIRTFAQRGQGQDYDFEFTTPLQPGTRTYQGTLYQQYAKGFGGPRVPLAFLSCSITL